MRPAARLASFAAAAVIGAGVASAQEYSFTFQTSAQAGDNFFSIEREWADRIETMSGGRVAIDLLPVNAVVQYNETLDAVGAGILSGHVTDPSYFAGRDPAFAMLGNLVGAWSHPSQMFGFMEYGGGKELFRELVEPYNLYFIGASATGVEALVSTVPIRTLEDFEGVRIRAPEGMVQEVFAAVGAAPVPLPGSEVYTALERQVIDAADYTVFSTNHGLGFHEFAPYPLYPGFHSMPVVDVSMNLDLWNSMPEDLQEIFTVATRDFAWDMVMRLERLDVEAAVQARAEGVEIINWPEEERARFRAVARDQWSEWAGRSEMAGRVYEAVTGYMLAQGLLEE